MNEVTFTKAEIWEAVLQMGGMQEDLTTEEVEKSKGEFFTLLDAVAANRGLGSPIAPGAIPAVGPSGVAAESEAK